MSNSLDRQINHIRDTFVRFMREYENGKLGSADVRAINLYLSLEAYFAMRKQAGVDIKATFAGVEHKDEKRGCCDAG